VDQAPSNSNKWLVCPRVKPTAEYRLFIFPYAGGGPAAFGKWYSEFPAHIELWTVHYPGRGSRHNDPPIKDATTLAEKTYQAIQPLIDKPFAFFGHSLGGLVAYELARSIRKNDLPHPNVLFLSACGAPHIPDPNPPIHAMTDSEFVKSLQDLNGIPVEVAAQPELLEILLPMLRADFEAAENYQFTLSKQPLTCPIVVFGGINDPRVSRERLEGWTLHTHSEFKTQYFPGDHFFITTARDEVIASITSELTAAYAKD